MKQVECRAESLCLSVCMCSYIDTYFCACVYLSEDMKKKKEAYSSKSHCNDDLRAEAVTLYETDPENM